jgi:hypothetical protein
MDQKDVLTMQSHPMNYPEALVARFQFLRVPHGDGLDMNEPSYNERIFNHVSSYSLDHIKSITEMPENSILKENLFVIPFIYARYEVIPSNEIKEYFRDIINAYKDSNNIYFKHFVDNFDSIMNQELQDSPGLIQVSQNLPTIIGIGVLSLIIGGIAFLFLRFLESLF